MDVNLSGDTALVTGASRGIGRGIAEAFATAGAKVAVNYPPVDEEQQAAAKVVESIRSEGGTAILLEGDVSDEESVREMISQFEDEFGTPDILVNNAGIAPQSRFDEMPVEMWERTMQVNLTGVFLTSRFVVPGMLERGSGKIINVASQLGFKGAEELVHYCATKGGVISFTRALAREVSPEINVNAIAPGSIDTDLTSGLSEEWRQAKEAEIPMNRLGEVRDVVPTALFLASSSSDYYTGQTLSPDGGDAMH